MTNKVITAFDQGVMIVKIGFSGTRKGMSQNQKDFVRSLLVQMHGEFHHGNCIGSDSEAHDIAEPLGYKICIHDPLDKGSNWAGRRGAIHYPPAPYHARNKNIVEKTAVLIATPLEFNGKGGTWNTIGWAKHFKRQFYIVLPNGEVYHDDFPQKEASLRDQIKSKGIILPN